MWLLMVGGIESRPVSYRAHQTMRNKKMLGLSPSIFLFDCSTSFYLNILTAAHALNARPPVVAPVRHNSVSPVGRFKSAISK